MAGDSRAERIARNEARFREINAELERGLSSIARDPDEQAAFACECGRLDCAHMVKLPLEEYQRAHEDDRHFVVRPGHQEGDVEDIVEEHDDYLVVQKKDIDDVTQIVSRDD